MREVKAQLPRYRIRTGYDVIASKFYAEIICDADLLNTYFSDDPAKAERFARARVAQLQRERQS